MLTIETRYHWHTNHAGARISASTTTARPSTGRKERIMRPLSHALGSADQHIAVARELAQIHGWPGRWVVFGETERGYLIGRVQSSYPAFEIAETEDSDDDDR